MPRLAPVTSRTCSKVCLLLSVVLYYTAKVRGLTHVPRVREATRSFFDASQQGEQFMGQFTDLRSADGFTFPAYIAQPPGKARGGVVVLQEIFGVNSHIRSVADGYAKEG